MKQKSNNKLLVDGLVIGAALFSMLFGAGNMIFPPYLGLKSGTQWFGGFLSYYIADIGLAIVTFLAMIKSGNNKELLKPVGKTCSNLLLFSVIMCTGPLISLPRTAATTFELSVLPLFPNVNKILFYILFFVTVLLLCINRSRVVDIVGKVLTPVLFIGLIYLIIQGILYPSQITQAPRVETSVIAEGIEAGYQSMDVLAAVIFGIIIIFSAKQKGHKTLESQQKITAIAGAVAGAGLLIVYLGLTYLGASFSSNFDPNTIQRTDLLTKLIEILIPGKGGLIFFGTVVMFACLSTAIALASSSAEYFAELTNEKVSYKTFVIIVCIFSGFVSLVGTDIIIKIASPILSIIYPPILTIVLLQFIDKFINKYIYRISAGVAFFISVIEVILNQLKIVDIIPLQRYSLGWLIPTITITVISIIICLIIKKTKSKENIKKI